MNILRNRNILKIFNFTRYMCSTNIICEKCGEIGVCRALSKKSSDEDEKIGLCSKALASILGSSHLTAINIIADNPNIIFIKPDNLKQLSEALRKHFQYIDIIRNSSVFFRSPLRTKECISILKEIGVSEMTIDKIFGFTDLIKKPMKQLKEEKIINNYDEIIKNMLMDLEVPIDQIDLLQDKMHETLWKNIDSMPVKYVRMSVLQQYLSWKLQCNENRIRKLGSFNRSVFNYCCQTLKRNLDILINDYQLSERKILSHLFLMTINPNRFQNIVQNIPVLANLDIKDCIKKKPSLLRTSVENILMIDDLVRKNGFTNKQLQNHLNIYNSRFHRIQKILKTIDNDPDLRLRKFHPQILFLVKNYNMIMKNLYHLRQKNLPFITLSMIFHRKDSEKYDYIRRNIFEIAYYLALKLNKSQVEVIKKLEIYPNIMWPSLLNVKNVTEYLLTNGITEDQFWNGIHIVFYSLNIVEKYFLKLPHYNEIQPFSEWKHHFNLVQLLLYYIEKEIGFNLENISLEKNEKLMLKNFTDEHL